MNKKYGVDEIKILEGIEAIRRRPGMYIGALEEKGIFQLFDDSDLARQSRSTIFGNLKCT